MAKLSFSEAAIKLENTSKPSGVELCIPRCAAVSVVGKLRCVVHSVSPSCFECFVAYDRVVHHWEVVNIKVG